jgi:GNAT superfamily N-acetyltransferase
MMTMIELSSTDPDPDVDPGTITLVPRADRELHAPDRHMVMTDRGVAVARCSCWWSSAPPLPGQRLGVVGHYAAADRTSGVALLLRACALLASAGCTLAVGPMDGNTWRRYRFIVDRGTEPAFFLEPDQPDGWPSHWIDAGFAPLARYTSAINEDLTVQDSRTAASTARLQDAGIAIRTFDPSRADEELQNVFRLSLAAFSRNFLYTPIAKGEFITQNMALLALLRPELILLAERERELVGYVFTIPDRLQARRGVPVDTVIIKTVVVAPDLAGHGLGSALIDRVQQCARQMGFRRAVHALMHEGNVSRTISGHYGRTIRQYALYSRPL